MKEDKRLNPVIAFVLVATFAFGMWTSSVWAAVWFFCTLSSLFAYAGYALSD